MKEDNTGTIFEKTMDAMIALLFGSIMILTSFQVLSRYVLFLPAPWVEELISFLFVWMIFLGASSAHMHQEHTRLELIPNESSNPLIKSMILTGRFFILILLIVVVVQGVTLVSSTLPMPSQILKLPMGILYLAAPVGASIMAWATISHIIKLLSRR